MVVCFICFEPGNSVLFFMLLKENNKTDKEETTSLPEGEK